MRKLPVEGTIRDLQSVPMRPDLAAAFRLHDVVWDLVDLGVVEPRGDFCEMVGRVLEPLFDPDPEEDR